MVIVRAIAAMTAERGIGYQGQMPWYLPEDFKLFKQLTLGHTVVMGSKTYWSLPDRARPLPGRISVVITRDLKRSYPLGVEIVSDISAWFRDTVAASHDESEDRQVWIIGGGEIYRETLQYCDELYISSVNGSFQTDTSFPIFEQDFQLDRSEDFSSFTLNIYGKRRKYFTCLELV
jgi:dihydrofolate reductase